MRRTCARHSLPLPFTGGSRTHSYRHLPFSFPSAFTSLTLSLLFAKRQPLILFSFAASTATITLMCPRSLFFWTVILPASSSAHRLIHHYTTLLSSRQCRWEHFDSCRCFVVYCQVSYYLQLRLSHRPVSLSLSFTSRRNCVTFSSYFLRFQIAFLQWLHVSVTLLQMNRFVVFLALDLFSCLCFSGG